MTKQSTATLSILAAGCLWGCLGLIINPLTDAGFSSMEIVALRCGGSTILYLLWLLWRDPSALRIQLCHLPYFLGSGLCSLVFFNWCYFNSIRESTLSVAVVLLYTAPAFVMLLSALLFHERVTRRKLLALLLTLLGCVLVVEMIPMGGAISPTALFFGLGSGFGYALYSIFGRYALAHYRPATVTFYTFFIAALGAVPLSGIWNTQHPLTTPTILTTIFALVVLGCILPYLLYTNGLQYTEPGRAAILATVEPFVGALVGIFLLGDGISAGKLSGMAAILVAVVLLNLPEKHYKKYYRQSSDSQN